MKYLIVLMLVLIIVLPVAAETDRERLVRIETKLDMILDHNQRVDTAQEKADLRIGTVEQKLNQHSYWFSVFGWVGGLIVSVVITTYGVMIKRYLDRRPPVTCKEGN